jgi:hypothetical protein
LAIRERICIFVNENKNYPPLPRLPTYKDKKKWQKKDLAKYTRFEGE